MSRRRLTAIVAVLSTVVLLAATAVSWGASRGRVHPGPACRTSARGRCHGLHGPARVRHHRRVRRTGNGPAPATGSAPAAAAPTAGVGALAPGQPPGPSSSQQVAPAAGVTATPPSPSVNTPAHLQVTAREYSLTLSRPTVVAGPVIVQFVNGGQDPHNLHLAAGGADAGAFALAQPGVRSNQTFQLGPGSYDFFCSLPNHQKLGMSATLIVN